LEPTSTEQLLVSVAYTETSLLLPLLTNFVNLPCSDNDVT